VLARQEAEEARNGDARCVSAHLQEARVHERSADLLQQTAALYRTRADRVASWKADRVPAEARLASTLRRTAEALDHTARLAEQAAGRLERSGQSDAAAAEREAAQRAREAAQRARSRAEGLAVDRKQ
jgi:hypothetical protein